jgi:hypothetical protein
MFISTSNYNNNIANHNSTMNTLDIASGSTAALQFTNPKHFNAYHGVAQTNNTVGTASSTASLAYPALSSAAATTTTSVQQQQQRRDELTQKLSQYTRQNDRRQILRALNDTKLFPRMHGPLPSVYGVEDIAMAEREAAGERASLNGVKFLQVNHHQHTMDHQPLDSYFLQTLREVCGHMCEMDAVDADPMALYGGLLLRLCRSASEHDALTVLTNYVCGSKGGELILLPLKRRHHDTTSSSTGAEMYLPMAVPLELDLYVESGNVHAKVTMRHELGLFKRSDLESAGFQKELSPWNALVMLIQQGQQQQPHQQSSSEMKQLNQIQYNIVSSSKFNKIRPWAYIDADVVERINFGTGCSVRMLHVCVPEDKNSGYVKK